VTGASGAPRSAGEVMEAHQGGGGPGASPSAHHVPDMGRCRKRTKAGKRRVAGMEGQYHPPAPGCWPASAPKQVSSACFWDGLGTRASQAAIKPLLEPAPPTARELRRRLAWSRRALTGQPRVCLADYACRRVHSGHHL
jgi:hypothetical protein